MALDTLRRQIDSLRSQASDSMRNYETARAAIESNSHLTADGKQAQLDPERAHLRNTLSGLEREEVKLLTEKMTSLQSSLVAKLGSSSFDIIAMRDAEERADRLQSQEDAARVIQPAILSGDKSLVLAILRRAQNSGWSDVTAMAVDAFPDTAETIRDIAEVDRALNGLDTTLHRSMLYSYL